MTQYINLSVTVRKIRALRKKLENKQGAGEAWRQLELLESRMTYIDDMQVFFNVPANTKSIP